jgi:hypothetical protein
MIQQQAKPNIEKATKEKKKQERFDARGRQAHGIMHIATTQVVLTKERTQCLVNGWYAKGFV